MTAALRAEVKAMISMGYTSWEKLEKKTGYTVTTLKNAISRTAKPRKYHFVEEAICTALLIDPETLTERPRKCYSVEEIIYEVYRYKSINKLTTDGVRRICGVSATQMAYFFQGTLCTSTAVLIAKRLGIPCDLRGEGK